MILRTAEFTPSAKTVTQARTGPSWVNTAPEESAPVTRTPLRTVAPASVASSARPQSKSWRFRWKAHRRKSGPTPEGPPTRTPESPRLTAPLGRGRPVRRQSGSMRSVAGLECAPISGAASSRRVSAPPRAAEYAAQSPATLAPTTKTSASLENECNDDRHLSCAPSFQKASRCRA